MIEALRYIRLEAAYWVALEHQLADLGSGTWLRRYGHLLSRHKLDLGYRLIVASLNSPPNKTMKTDAR